ncbi:DUF2478 domain-containing protein [Corticibacter populi]|nr:DUF2478 domain-containing protein [Corticibacter populi]RZS33478.1 uncharacterized protein DUF2478 [Corticibacter populi]
MTASLAAVLHDGHGIAEPVLHDFVAWARRQGWRVRGLLQVSEVELPDPVSGGQCQRHMELVDIEQGRRYLISQSLGKGSASCCLDAAGVAEASAVLRRALVERPDLVVANRFGKLEVEGGGLRQEMAAVVEAGVPLLTALDRRFLGEWQQFAAELGQTLPPEVPALQRWWLAQLAARQTGASV